MTPTERTGGRCATLYSRETLPAPAARQRERLSRRLNDLETTDDLSSFSVEAWEKRIRCTGPEDEAARDRYLRFAAWAREYGVRLRPFFGTRECYSMETGEKDDWIVFPAICLAVYEDGDLAAVFPHADGDTYRSVSDGLDELAQRDPHWAGDSADESNDRERVPVEPAD
jgi:hypothetical protein